MLSQIVEVVWFVNDNGLPNAEGTLTTHKCPGNVYPCDPPKSIAEVCDSIDSSVLNVETCNEGIESFRKNVGMITVSTYILPSSYSEVLWQLEVPPTIEILQ